MLYCFYCKMELPKRRVFCGENHRVLYEYHNQKSANTIEDFSFHKTLNIFYRRIHYPPQSFGAVKRVMRCDDGILMINNQIIDERRFEFTTGIFTVHHVFKML